MTYNNTRCNQYSSRGSRTGACAKAYHALPAKHNNAECTKGRKEGGRILKHFVRPRDHNTFYSYTDGRTACA
jgi:hypothetical protein